LSFPGKRAARGRKFRPVPRRWRRNRKDTDRYLNYGRVERKDTDRYLNDGRLNRKDTDLCLNYGRVDRKDTDLCLSYGRVNRKDTDRYLNYGRVDRKDTDLRLKDDRLGRCNPARNGRIAPWSGKTPLRIRTLACRSGKACDLSIFFRSRMIHGFEAREDFTRFRYFRTMKAVRSGSFLEDVRLREKTQLQPA
jgi:hypothetical protein